MIPFLDLRRIHEPLLDEFVNSLRDIVCRSAFINGGELKEFEEEFAKYVGTRYCVGLSSGFDAELIALKSLGLKAGERVIVPAMTFVATVSAVKMAGGTPCLVDVDSSGLMDLNQVESLLKKGSQPFVLPVHLFGQLISPTSLKTLNEKYSAIIVEDSCQAHGARIGNYSAGSIGEVSAFSFYPGKNLGALGDGGALCTNREDIYNIARALREHGQVSKNNHQSVGYTARLDNLQAAFLKTKLKSLNLVTKNRIEAAKYYAKHLENLPNLTFQSTKLEGEHVYHLYVVLTQRRQALIEEFMQREIGYGLHYPTPIHQLPCFSGEKWVEGIFPNAEKYAREGISLPLFPGITQAEQDQVIEAIQKICS